MSTSDVFFCARLGKCATETKQQDERREREDEEKRR